jgi:predicted transcriptional regulator
MNQFPVRYAFRLDPATEAALEQIAQHTFQSKASIMRRYIQEGVRKERTT